MRQAPITPSTTPMRYPKLTITSMMAPAKPHSAKSFAPATQRLGEDGRAEIGEHPHQDRLRHHGADIGAGKQHHGTDKRRKDAAEPPTAPDFSINIAPLSERLPPAPPSHRREDVGKAVGAELLVEVCDFCRATSRLDTSSSMEIAVMPHTAPISALDCASTPQSTSCCITAEIGHHSVSCPMLGRNHALRTPRPGRSRTG